MHDDAASIKLRGAVDGPGKHKGTTVGQPQRKRTQALSDLQLSVRMEIPGFAKVNGDCQAGTGFLFGDQKLGFAKFGPSGILRLGRR